MTDLRSRHEPIDDIEALIRSAKDYVHASDDLRPRILEAARSQRGEQRALGYLRQAAIVLAILGLLTLARRGTTDHAEPALLAAVSAEDLLSAAAEDRNWGLVDSFTELRQRQAELFGTSAEHPRHKG